MTRVSVDIGQYRSFLRGYGMGFWRWDKKLDLRGRPGVLRLGFWGSGSGFSVNQHQSNMVVSKGETVVFIDLGSKLTQRLAEFGLSVHDIPNVIITHSHADHVGSMEELGLKRRYEAPVLKAMEEGLGLPTGANDGLWKRADAIRRSGLLRVPVYVPEEYAVDLWKQSLQGGMGHSEEGEKGSPGSIMGLTDFYDLKPVARRAWRHGREAWEFTVGGGADAIHFLIYRTPHIPEAVSRIDHTFFSAGIILDERVLISGDTRHDPDVIREEGMRAEHVFHDCQSFPGGVHAYYGELKSLPAEVRRKILFYHCDDGMRPLKPDGTIGAVDVLKDGFRGFAETAPVFYEF